MAVIMAVPFIVFALIYWSDPKYLGGFFTDDRLIAIGLGGLGWMSIGVFIMLLTVLATALMPSLTGLAPKPPLTSLR